MARELTTSGRPMLLDEILAEIFGAAVARGMVAQTLDLNPGLAALGPAIPPGTLLRLPDAAPANARSAPVIDLFG